MVTWSAIIGQFRNAAQGHDSLHTNVLLKGQDGEMMDRSTTRVHQPLESSVWAISSTVRLT